jgi:hypothetical protein
MISIKDILPCPKCKEHYKENLKSYPLTDNIMSNKDLFVKWVIDIHNKVNEIRNKPIIPYEDALKLIDTDIKCTNIIENMDNVQRKQNNNSNSNSNSHSNYLVSTLYVILIGLIFVAIIYKKKK